MKIFGILSTAIFLFTCSICIAQDTIRVNLTDTIHLSGYLKYPDGSPCEYVFIRSKTNGLINTVTDENGFFKLIALFEDTYVTESKTFKNVGSRFINIEIPLFVGQLEADKKAYRLSPRLSKDTIITYLSKSGVFSHNESLANFPGGLQLFNKTVLNDKIKYPEKALLANIEGQVIVGFLIDKKGNVCKIKLIKSLGYGCDEEVIKAISNSPRWTPSVFNGRLRSQNMQIIYTFKLLD